MGVQNDKWVLPSIREFWVHFSLLLTSDIQKQLQNLEDACEDIMLADDDCLMIPYQIGDVFISHSQEETQEMLEEAKVCWNLSLEGEVYLLN